MQFGSRDGAEILTDFGGGVNSTSHDKVPPPPHPPRSGQRLTPHPAPFRNVLIQKPLFQIRAVTERVEKNRICYVPSTIEPLMVERKVLFWCNMLISQMRILNSEKVGD